jgi:hypothetical protein
MRLVYFLSFIFVAVTASSQTVTKNLLNATSYSYKKNILVYGFEETKPNLLFKCYLYNTSLKIKDSVVFNLGKHIAQDYLETSIDTNHNVLNFYFQLANEKNVVTLLRLNDTLGKICSAENFDANHVNSIAVFDDEKYIFKNDLYVIRTNKDTSGTQFYLNKYELKSMLKPFEYKDKWQFAFERRFIHRASVLHADSSFVLVYVHVNDGPKKGQWLLRINATTGLLIKGTRINNKSDAKNFLVSNWHYDKKLKTMDLIGSIYEGDMINFKKGTSNFINLSKRHHLFLVSIDSMGEVISKTEKLMALPIQTNKLNFTTSYHLKVRSFIKNKDNSFDVWTDMYEQALPNTFVYYSSWFIAITPNELDYDITPSKFMIASNAIKGLIGYDKGDVYGKFILDNIMQYDRFKYKKPLNSIIIQTQMDDVGNPNFVLSKTTILTGKKTFNYASVGIKGLENKVIETSDKLYKGVIYFTKPSTYIFFQTNSINTGYELKLKELVF